MVTLDRLSELTVKSIAVFAFEEYTTEFNFYSKIFFEEPHLRETIGNAFCTSLDRQPKKKAMYQSFLERQEDPNPKLTNNALRFLKEMQLKTEFQTR